MPNQTYVVQPTPAPSVAQQPAVAPSAPPATQPGTAVTAIFSDGSSLPVQGIPRTPEELLGLRERRELLGDQLQSAVNRRSELSDELAAERERPLDPQEVATLQMRRTVLDGRIIQLEREQAATDQLLSNAPPSLLAQAAVDAQRRESMVDEGEATAIAFSTFGLGVVLTLLIGRFRRRRARHTSSNAPPAAPLMLGDDPRIDRLTMAVDAIAEEVERIGEGQRFVTQLLAGRPQAQAVQVQPQPPLVAAPPRERA